MLVPPPPPPLPTVSLAELLLVVLDVHLGASRLMVLGGFSIPAEGTCCTTTQDFVAVMMTTGLS